MTRLQRLKRNPRLLFWGKALTELKTLNAVIVLFYLHRGVTLEEVFYLTLVWSITTLIFEVPSGYLADRIGRKKTLMLGSLVLIGAFVAQWFAQGFWMFVVVQSLISLAYSAFSGTEEALLYDSLKEIGEEKNMTHHYGRYLSAKNVFKIFAPTIGAFIAKDLLESQFQILIGVEIFAIAVSFVVLLFLIEPKHDRSVEDYEKGIFTNSIEIIKSQPMLLRVAMNRVLFLIAGVLVWRVYQPMFVDLGFSIFWLGAYYFLMQVGAFLLSWHAKKIAESIGLRMIFLAGGWTAVFMMFAGALIDNKWIVFAALLLSVLFSVMMSPHFSDIFNRRLKSWNRATTLSTLNLLKGILDIPVMLFAGYLAISGEEEVIFFAVALCLVALFLFPMKKSDFA